MRVSAVVAAFMLVTWGQAGSGADSRIPADDVIKARIAKFREIGTAYKAIGDQLKMARPSASKIEESANLIKGRGEEMISWFPAGSEGQPPKSYFARLTTWLFGGNDVTLPGEEESHARRAIWTERKRFEQANASFLVEADRMLRSAKTGGTSELSARFKALGETCKACHDVFREKID